MSERLEREPEEIEDLIRRGQLEEARLALVQEAGVDPGVTILFATLSAQVSAFAAGFEVLSKLRTSHPEWATVCAELQLCLEAEAMWEQRLVDTDSAAKRAGLAPPPRYAEHQLEALVYHAAEQWEDVRSELAAARASVPPITGEVVRNDGRVARFVSLRDSDALVGSLLVAVGPRGPLDVPFSQLRSVEWVPAASYHDAIWQVARLVTETGRELTVRIPVRYPLTGKDELGEVRSGALTVWDRAEGYAVARGARELVFGMEDGKELSLACYQLARVSFDGTESG